MNTSLSKSGVPWCDKGWPILRGCSPASEGCRNCYAARWHHRFAKHMGLPPWGMAQFLPENLDMPYHTKEPSRVFVAPMSDMFHPTVETGMIVAILDVIRQCPQHTFIVLTKRPRRLLEPQLVLPGDRTEPLGTWFDMPNVWLGVTAENQERADERVPILLESPAAVRFVSVEPMLGPIDLCHRYSRSAASLANPCSPPTYDQVNYISGFRGTADHHSRGAGFITTKRLDWVIAGPETGPNARHCEDAWIDALANESPRFYDKRKDWKRREFPVPNKVFCVSGERQKGQTT